MMRSLINWSFDIFFSFRFLPLPIDFWKVAAQRLLLVIVYGEYCHLPL
jgi:hypothetical protein